MPIDREVWLITIAAISLCGLIWGLMDTRRVIEAPFLYGYGMAMILIPQLYAVSINPWLVPDEAFTVFVTMVVLCSFFLFLGYFQNNTSSITRSHQYQTQWVINDRKLFWFGVVVAVLGTIGSIRLRQLGVIEVWRGWAVYWLTLSKLTLPGITLIMISYAQSKDVKRLMAVIVFSIFPIITLITAGRRSLAIVLPLVYILPIFLYKPSLRIPRWLILLSGLGALIVVYAFPYWRGYFDTGDHLKAIEQVSIEEIVDDTLSGDPNKPSEISDGMIITGARYNLDKYEYGIVGWYNSIVLRYVPGGLIGRDLKESLYLGEGSIENVDWVESVYGIPVASYTAKSGFSDLFAQFSFFGAIFMYFLGRIFKKINYSIVENFNGRSIIFLCFFISFPAAVSYAPFFHSLITQLPSIFIMLLAMKVCTYPYKYSAIPKKDIIFQQRLITQ